MLGTIKTILENITEESRIDVFDLFAESLLALLNGCCSQGKAGRQDKASFWTRFQQIRTRELVSVWRKLGQNLHLEIHPVISHTFSVLGSASDIIIQLGGRSTSNKDCIDTCVFPYRSSPI